MYICSYITYGNENFEYINFALALVYILDKNYRGFLICFLFREYSLV